MACSALANEGAAPQIDIKLALPDRGFRHAGYYMALEKGYFKEAGLAVSITESSNTIASVIKGETAFGVAGAETLIYRASGLPVMSVAAIFQHSPAVIVARSGNLTHLAGLAERQMLQDGEQPEIDAFLKTQKIVPTVEDDHAPVLKFLQGGADSVSLRTVRERLEIQNAGIPLAIFSPRASGIDFYGDILLTHADRVKDDEKTVGAFRNAVIKGWQYALAHQAETADLIVKKYLPDSRPGLLLQEAAELAQLIQPDLIALGHQDKQRWEQIAKVFQDTGYIKSPVAIEPFLYSSKNTALPDWVTYVSLIGIPALIVVVFLLIRLRQFKRKLTLSQEEVIRGKLALKEHALWDSVVELHNKRYFDPTLERECVRARRKKAKIPFVMVDIDNLRSVNDRWGRAGGDAAMKMVVGVLKSHLREEDIICRYDDAEIAILLPDMAIDMAKARCETLREEIAQTSITSGEKKFNVTASFGVTLWPDRATTSAALLQSARSALHAAKGMGRDRVVLAK